jgi:hypothetical protein
MQKAVIRYTCGFCCRELNIQLSQGEYYKMNPGECWDLEK